VILKIEGIKNAQAIEGVRLQVRDVCVRQKQPGRNNIPEGKRLDNFDKLKEKGR